MDFAKGYANDCEKGYVKGYARDYGTHSIRGTHEQATRDGRHGQNYRVLHEEEAIRYE